MRKVCNSTMNPKLMCLTLRTIRSESFVNLKLTQEIRWHRFHRCRSHCRGVSRGSHPSSFGVAPLPICTSREDVKVATILNSDFLKL